MESQATIIGRSHQIRQQNNHDFAINGRPRIGTVFGLVLDGCGSKYIHQPASSEVGAKLLGQFAAGWLNERLANNESIDPAGLIPGLFDDCLDFLRKMTNLIPFIDETARTAYVMTHWLTTLIGFVVTAETAVLFWQGDGYLCINGEVTTMDSDNRPDYLAYQLLGQRESGRFHMETIDRSTLQWLAIATDGWRPELLTQLAEPRSSLLLQRWLNVQAKQPGNFDDDGAIAVWYGQDKL